MDIESHSDGLSSDKEIIHSYDEAVEKTGKLFDFTSESLLYLKANCYLRSLNEFNEYVFNTVDYL